MKNDRVLIRNLILLVVTALAVQVMCRYYSRLLIVENFYIIPFVLRFGVPILMIHFVFGGKWSEWGIRFPTKDKLVRSIFLMGMVLIPIVVIGGILSDPRYSAAYPQYTNDQIPLWDRWMAFGAFTLSTFFSWAFIHRAYLTFGLQRLLALLTPRSDSFATVVAILWTASFEVLYHLIKPDLEAWGMLLVSPLFGWMALRTKSVLLPLILHFWVEVCFILTLTVLI